MDVELKETESRMVLKFGEKFDYDKSLNMDITLHSKSIFKMTVKFIPVSKCELDDFIYATSLKYFGSLKLNITGKNQHISSILSYQINFYVFLKK